MPALDGLPGQSRTDRTIYIETYGCQMNVADSELIAGVLARGGYASVANPEHADIILLNTCAIRENAEQRVAQRVRHFISARENNSRVRIGLAGCMAQHHRDRLLNAIPGLDFVVGPDGYRRLAQLLDAEEPGTDVRLDRSETYQDIAPVRASGVRAWLTIMRGCNRFCTFCVVPYVRGRERSLPADVLIKEAHSIAAHGFREIVLLGQTVNAYNDGTTDFGALLRMMSDIDGIDRVRFTSPHPADMADSAIEAMRDCGKVSPYLHLPLQSGSDRILAAMDRGHTIDEYMRLVERLRIEIPDIALSTDIIVGYPGETEADFAATADLMDEVGYDHAFMFKYSRREGTRAEKVKETVSEQDKNARLQRLIAEQLTRATAINQKRIGHATEVLAEFPARKQKGWLSGKDPQFKTVVFEPKSTDVGRLVTVMIESAGPQTLLGREV